MPTEDLIQALAVTAELCGTNLSDPAKRMMLQDLGAYSEHLVIAALTSCRKQLRSRLTLAEIIARIDDGRPGAEEAWAKLPRTEMQTAVWADEMRQAWTVALPLLDAGEDISARMAFKEAYQRAVIKARDDGMAVVWSVSMGTDAETRKAVIQEAVINGLLTHEKAKLYLPIDVPPVEEVLMLAANNDALPPERALAILAGLQEKFSLKA